MLVPVTRKTFESLVPAVATGNQYAHCWGQLKDLLRRVLISVVGMFAVLLLYMLSGYSFGELFLIVGLVVGLYWLWEPAVKASLKNLEYRRYGYAGFWQGRVMDVFVSEELVGTEETVNNRGDLVVVENRERCLNLEVADRSGFSASVRVPIKKAYRAIDIGDAAEMLVFSNRSDLGRIANNSDIYIPDHKVWVGDYPCLQHDAFIEVSRRLTVRYQEEIEAEAEAPRRKRTPRSETRRESFLEPEEFEPQERSRNRDSSKRPGSENRLRRRGEDLRGADRIAQSEDDRPRRTSRYDTPDSRSSRRDSQSSERRLRSDDRQNYSSSETPRRTPSRRRPSS